MSRVLLTGAAGFVGSHLADRLVGDGHHVIGVDNLSSGAPANVAQLALSPAFELREADVCQPLNIEGDIDWVLHFASPASPPRFLEQPIETLRANGVGTYNLLTLALDKGASFMLASTSEVYGDPLVSPQPESYWGNVNPIGPRSVYDEAKRYAESMTTAFQVAHGVPVRICRIFNTYGPRMSPDDGRVVSNLLRQALSGEPLTIYGDGRQTRSFQYVDDLIEGLVRLMNSSHDGPMNLGNPTEYNMLELAALVHKLTGSEVPIEFQPLPQDDPRQRRPDISLARSVLGWEPAIGLEEGLARTIEAYRRIGVGGQSVVQA